MSTNTQYFISKVAEKNGVTYDQVYADMREAILAGFYSTDPEVQAMWKSIPFKGEEPLQCFLKMSNFCSEQAA